MAKWTTATIAKTDKLPAICERLALMLPNAIAVSMVIILPSWFLG